MPVPLESISKIVVEGELSCEVDEDTVYAILRIDKEETNLTSLFFDKLDQKKKYRIVVEEV